MKLLLFGESPLATFESFASLARYKFKFENRWTSSQRSLARHLFLRRVRGIGEITFVLIWFVSPRNQHFISTQFSSINEIGNSIVFVSREIDARPQSFVVLSCHASKSKANRRRLKAILILLGFFLSWWRLRLPASKALEFNWNWISCARSSKCYARFSWKPKTEENTLQSLVFQSFSSGINARCFFDRNRPT